MRRSGSTRTAIEERDLERLLDVRPVEHRDAALIEGLHHDVAAGNRNQRAVVRDAVLGVGLRCRDLVVAVEHQLALLDREERVAAPLRAIGRPALRTAAAAPLVGEQHLGAVVAERRRVPQCHVRVAGEVHAHRVRRFADVEQQAVADARAAGETDRRIQRDVVALVRARRWAAVAAASAAAATPGRRRRTGCARSARRRRRRRACRATGHDRTTRRAASTCRRGPASAIAAAARAAAARRIRLVVRRALRVARRARETLEDLRAVHDLRVLRRLQRHLDDSMRNCDAVRIDAVGDAVRPSLQPGARRTIPEM